MKKTLLPLLMLFLALAVHAQTTLWGTPITEQPSGQLFDWQTGDGISANVDYLITVEHDDCFRCTYVLADDALYIRDPFIKAETDTWLKLDKVSDTTYVAHLPQAILLLNDQGKTYSFSARRLVFRNTDPKRYTDQRAAMYAKFYIPDTLADGTVRNDIYYTFKDQTLTQRDTCWLALVNDSTNVFAGYGTRQLVVKPMNDQVFVPSPDEVSGADSTWVLHYAVNDSVFNNMFVKVAVNGNNIYLANPANTDSTQWIRGTLDGQTMTMENGQYLGFNNNSQHYVYALTLGYTDKDTLDYWGYPYTERTYDFTRPSLAFAVSNQGETFTAPKGTALAINASKRRIYQYGLYPDPVLFKFHEVAATPTSPIWKRVDEYREDYGYGTIVFQQPETDKDGKFINFNKLYFRLYIDDDKTPYEFEPDEYEGLSESSSMLPIRLKNDNYFTIGDEHYLHYFTSGWSRLGLQAVYLGGGRESTSPIIWYDEPTAILGVKENRNVKTRYYDLTGREVAPSAHGMVIKVTQASDGTTTTKKIVK